jgi:hypothetical protein
VSVFLPSLSGREINVLNAELNAREQTDVKISDVLSNSQGLPR